MPIKLVTDLPGHNKTHKTLNNLKSETRNIYYHGIKDVKLDWTHLDDPTLWMECEPNSIIVIDEAQEIFPVMKTGDNRPHHYQDIFLELHRSR